MRVELFSPAEMGQSGDCSANASFKRCAHRSNLNAITARIPEQTRLECSRSSMAVKDARRATSASDVVQPWPKISMVVLLCSIINVITRQTYL